METGAWGTAVGPCNTYCYPLQLSLTRKVPVIVIDGEVKGVGKGGRDWGGDRVMSSPHVYPRSPTRMETLPGFPTVG